MNDPIKKSMAPEPRPQTQVGSGWAGPVYFDMPVERRIELSRLVHAPMPVAEFGRQREAFWRELGAELGFVPSTVTNFQTSIDYEGIVGFCAEPANVMPLRDDGPAWRWVKSQVPDPGSLSSPGAIRSAAVEAWHAGREAAIIDWAEGLRLPESGRNIASESGDQMTIPAWKPHALGYAMDFVGIGLGIGLPIWLGWADRMPGAWALAVGAIGTLITIRLCDRILIALAQRMAARAGR